MLLLVNSHGHILPMKQNFRWKIALNKSVKHIKPVDASSVIMRNAHPTKPSNDRSTP